MKRKAIIIVIPDYKGEKKYLPGPIQDANNYKNYLMSSKGGQWYGNGEIDIFENIDINDWKIIKNIFNKQEYDYTFTVFSGHGYYNGVDEKRYVELYGGAAIPINEFYHETCKRQTLIIDSCSKVYYSKTKRFIKRGILTDSVKYADATREIFDYYVQESEEGIVRLFSSSKNQASGDSEYGGLFSRSLIKAGEDWNDSDKDVLDIYDAFTLSKEYLSFLDPIQKPEIDAGKRLEYFPFAVK